MAETQSRVDAVMQAAGDGSASSRGRSQSPPPVSLSEFDGVANDVHVNSNVTCPVRVRLQHQGCLDCMRWECARIFLFHHTFVAGDREIYKQIASTRQRKLCAFAVCTKILKKYQMMRMCSQATGLQY